MDGRYSQIRINLNFFYNIQRKGITIFLKILKAQKVYGLKFDSRVKLPSVKNFRLVHKGGKRKKIIHFLKY